jgi:uracil-DNA glycosylase family 4
MRKVGCDGNIDSDFVLTGEAPGTDETKFERGRRKYGLPFVGKSGWTMKAYLLGPAGLADVRTKPGSKWPRVVSVKPFIANVAMCQPPKNKIDSPQGRRAVLCCGDSYTAMIQELEKRKPRMFIQLGGTALQAMTGETKIGQHRGRFKWVDIAKLEPRGFDAVAKLVLRGVKPPPEFNTEQSLLPTGERTDDDCEVKVNHLKTIKAFITFGRACWRRRCKPPKTPKVKKERKKKEAQ